MSGVWASPDVVLWLTGDGIAVFKEGCEGRQLETRSDTLAYWFAPDGEAFLNFFGTFDLERS